MISRADCLEKDAADPIAVYTMTFPSGTTAPVSDYDERAKRLLEATAEIDAEDGYPAQLESLKRFGVYPHKAKQP